MFYTLSGFFVGFLVGLTGVGGGSLMTPLLVLMFKVPATLAVGTDLLYASLTKTLGVFAHHKLKNIDWRIVKNLMFGSIPASLITSLLLNCYGLAQQETLSKIIQIFLGVALIFTAIAIFFQPLIISKALKAPEISRKKKKITTIILGIMLGLIVTFTSVGAGALGVTMLLILYPGLNIKKIIDTDIAHAVPLTLVAGLGHASMGSVDYYLLLTLLAGSLPGVWLGAKMNSKINDQFIRLILIILLISIALKLIGSNI